MRGAKLVFCRERNKIRKNINLLELISVYFIFKIKNGRVQIAVGQKIQLFKLALV